MDEACEGNLVGLVILQYGCVAAADPIIPNVKRFTLPGIRLRYVHGENRNGWEARRLE